MQDGQLDAVGRVHYVPERGTEQPGQVLGRPVGRYERGSAERELLAAQAPSVVAAASPDVTRYARTSSVSGLVRPGAHISLFGPLDGTVGPGDPGCVAVRLGMGVERDIGLPAE
jgi:hypothetical protein